MTRASSALLPALALALLSALAPPAPAGSYDPATGLFRLTYTYAHLPNGADAAAAVQSAEAAKTPELDAIVDRFYRAVSDDLGRLTGGRGYLAAPEYTADISKADVLISPDTPFTLGGGYRGGWGTLNGFAHNVGPLALYIQSLRLGGYSDEGQRLTVVHELCHYLFGLPDEYGQSYCPLPGAPGGRGCIMDNYNVRQWPGYLCDDGGFGHNPGAVTYHDPNNSPGLSCQAIVDEFFAQAGVPIGTRFDPPGATTTPAVQPTPTVPTTPVTPDPVPVAARPAGPIPPKSLEAEDQLIRSRAALLAVADPPGYSDWQMVALIAGDLARLPGGIGPTLLAPELDYIMAVARQAKAAAIPARPAIPATPVLVQPTGPAWPVPPALFAAVAPKIQAEANRLAAMAGMSGPGGSLTILDGLIRFVTDNKMPTIRDAEYAFLEGTASAAVAAIKQATVVANPASASPQLDRIESKIDDLPAKVRPGVTPPSARPPSSAPRGLVPVPMPRSTSAGPRSIPIPRGRAWRLAPSTPPAPTPRGFTPGMPAPPGGARP